MCLVLALYVGFCVAIHTWTWLKKSCQRKPIFMVAERDPCSRNEARPPGIHGKIRRMACICGGNVHAAHRRGGEFHCPDRIVAKHDPDYAAAADQRNQGTLTRKSADLGTFTSV